AGGKWARISELPDDWPSAAYQRVVNADGAASESVLRLRMDAAGVELVRAADPALEQGAGEHRVANLDPDPAPNTAPADYAELSVFERDVEPGERNDERLVNPVHDPTWCLADQTTGATRGKGKGR
ncbi:MAG TPA: hypothetical protein VH683_06790, partial [Thermoleophilaceae bacterium]